MKVTKGSILGGLAAVAVLTYVTLWVSSRLHQPVPNPNVQHFLDQEHNPSATAESILYAFVMAERSWADGQAGKEPRVPFGTIGDLISAGSLRDFRLTSRGNGVFQQDETLYLIYTTAEGRSGKPAWCAVAWPAPSKDPRSKPAPALFVDPELNLWSSSAFSVPDGTRPELAEYFQGAAWTSPVREDRWTRLKGSFFR